MLYDYCTLVMLQQEKLISLLNRVMNQNARLRKGYTQAMFHCPFCNERKKVPKLEICLEGNNVGSWHCWICNSRGTTLKSLFFKLRAPKQYIDELYSIIGNVYREKKEYTLDEVHLLPKEFKSLSIDSDSYSFGHAWYYLSQRGITRNDVLRYNIGYCEGGLYNKRIIVPSYDKDGNLNFFSARDYSGESPFKYMLSPWSKDIIGFEVFINWSEQVTLVEGCFDAISVKNNVIPLFGTSMPFSLKLAIIQNRVKRVNIVLDNDALKQAIDIFDHIEDIQVNKIDVHLIKLEDKDPSILGFEKVNDIIKSSKPFDFSDSIRHKLKL